MLTVIAQEFIDVMVPCMFRAATIASQAIETTVIAKAHEEIVGSEGEIDRASRVDVCSTTDIAIQEMLLAAILKNWPFVSVLAEEDSPTIARFPKSSKYTILIDPIDGTKNYLKGNTKYCHIISLMEHGRMLVTLLYIHAMRRLFVATQGYGVNALSKFNQSVAIRLSDPATNIFFHHVSRVPPALLQELELMEFRIATSIQNASDILTLLDGKAQGFISYTPLIYDVWSPGMIVEEAGGWLSDWYGNPLSFDGKRRLPHVLIAASPQVASLVIDKLRKYL